jgi:hypothetical protein
MNLDWIKIFKCSAVAILLATAAAKLASVGMDKQGILRATDPLLFMPNRVVLTVAALLELLVASILMFSSRAWLGGLCCATLGAQFLLYHTAFQLGGMSRGCPCLGTLGSWIPLSEKSLNVVMGTAALGLCFGGACLFITAYDRRKAPAT